MVKLRAEDKENCRPSSGNSDSNNNSNSDSNSNSNNNSNSNSNTNSNNCRPSSGELLKPPMKSVKNTYEERNTASDENSGAETAEMEPMNPTSSEVFCKEYTSSSLLTVSTAPSLSFSSTMTQSRHQLSFGPEDTSLLAIDSPPAGIDSPPRLGSVSPQADSHAHDASRLEDENLCRRIAEAVNSGNMNKAVEMMAAYNADKIQPTAYAGKLGGDHDMVRDVLETRSLSFDSVLETEERPLQRTISCPLEPILGVDRNSCALSTAVEEMEDGKRLSKRCRLRDKLRRRSRKEDAVKKRGCREERRQSNICIIFEDAVKQRRTRWWFCY